MIYQNTISKPVTVTGIGIHSGKKVTMTLKPALAGSGIVFQRIDLEDKPLLPANALTVGATENQTVLGQGISAVHTVEHLLSAFYGFGIDNIFCEIDGPEVPIMDGSGTSFVYLLKQAGIKELTHYKEFLIVDKTVTVEHGDKWATIEPCRDFIIDSTIVFPHPSIKKQSRSFLFSEENYQKEISKARTFGLLRDVDMLKRKGLIQGGSLNNAIVLDEFNVVNPEGLRYFDEFIRHKILDTIGDLSLLGYGVKGKVTTFKSGHMVHNLLCRKLLEDPRNYHIEKANLFWRKNEDINTAMENL